MLVSPKWQTMWMESQHSAKSIINVPLPSQQAQKILEDLKTSCNSPNKAIQLEALKCWGMWINNQNPDDWKLNTVCFTAVRPLITKKLQPLHKDIDICKLKLSLLWALLVKVQGIMHLEGPQYILEVFIQSCLTWLSSTSGFGSENEICTLINQLLLAIFNKNEILTDCDKEMFPSLSCDILANKKIFHRLADKFSNVFIYWRNTQDKSVILKIWKYFLEHCELSSEHIPIPVWHKIFKLAGQICSEKNEPVKERLAFLHGCATTLKSALSSSKFIDIGNLLTTPCEALLKKLVELCTVECEGLCDSQMFFHSKEISEVLSEKNIDVGGYDLCLNVLDVLDEFCLRSLFWGVWCGLVYCYKVKLSGTEKKHLTKTQNKFYRRLRGIAVNFELDRDELHKDCISEVEKNIQVLNIGCLCLSRPDNTKDAENAKTLQPVVTSQEIVPKSFGQFSSVALYRRNQPIRRISVSLSSDLIKDILSSVDVNFTKLLFSSLLSFRFIKITNERKEIVSNNSLVPLRTPQTNEIKLEMSCVKTTPVKKNFVEENDDDSDDETIFSTPRTRSKKRAEEEEKKKELENQRRKKRKSFEVIVQEIVRKNKERKTEKNSKRRKSPDASKAKRCKKRIEKEKPKSEKKKENKEVPERRLRNSAKEEPIQKKEKTDGKLEHYFKVITKKTGSDVKKDAKILKTNKKKKKEKENRCCDEKEEGERKNEIGWKQTSLKTMMSRKGKTEKVKQVIKARKNPDVPKEKPKMKNENKKVSDSPLAKLSPFKEVFHDHEYAKIEREDLQTLERVFVRKTIENLSEKSVEVQKAKPLVLEKLELIEVKKVEVDKTPEVVLSKPNLESSGTPVVEVDTKERETPLMDIVHSPKKETDEEVLNSTEPQPEECTEIKSGRRGKKRIKMLDSLKPSKKIKLEVEEKLEILEKEEKLPLEVMEEEKLPIEVIEKENLEEKLPLEVMEEEKLPLEIIEKENLEEKLPIEVIEKENLEEKQSEMISMVKKEKPLMPKNEGSPKGMNGIISSRALRMIALLPESTKGGQMQWESPSRVDPLKCKKAPNVDKYSRASKMLALLSDNCLVDPEELIETNDEELNSSKAVATTPNVKTPVSSLKSPKSTKKRRSIRFDDAKNETVLYQTDKPPSQILEEKEKCRRMRPSDVTD